MTRCLVLVFMAQLLGMPNLWAQLPERQARERAERHALRSQALRAFSLEAALRAEREKAEALRLADSLNLPVRLELPDGRVSELMRLDERGMPMYYITHNAEGAALIKSDQVYEGGGAGLALSGAGQTLGIWDNGKVRDTHQEFMDNGISRVTQKDGATNIRDHATHVAGTMVASGVVSDAKGMAPAAMLDAYDWDLDQSEMAAAAENGLMVSQHSYGFISGWYHNPNNNWWYWYGDVSISETEDYYFGFYSFQAEHWDAIAYNAPHYLIVRSAGNDRGRGPSPGTEHYVFVSGTGWVTSTATRDKNGGEDGYQSISDAGNAKNILTVGSVNAAQTIASSSGWGPTDDGRVKPDIVAKGVSVYSTRHLTNSHYGSKSGTSMSGPMVSGSVGLLLEHQQNLHPDTLLLASSMRALILHSADTDISGAPGPDYRFGWGLMDTEAAAGIMSRDALHGGSFKVRELVLEDGGTISLTVYASGEEGLKATLAWTDPPGTEPPPSLNPPDLMLVNDLDMRISNSAQSTSWKPYILDPAQPGEPATTGDNFRDNIEQILVADAAAGARYTLSISHKNSLKNNESQDFSLVITGIAIPEVYAGSSSDWDDPANWDNGGPETMDHILIPAGATHMPVISGAAHAQNLSVEAGAALRITQGGTLTVSGTLVLEGSPDKGTGAQLILEPGSRLSVNGRLLNLAGPDALQLLAGGAGTISPTASLIHDSQGVEARVELRLDPPAKSGGSPWHQLSAPVIDQEIQGEFYTAGDAFFAWHEAAQRWVSIQNQSVWPTWDDANLATTTFVSGKGYMAAYPLAQTITKTFTGKLGAGTVSLSLQRSAHPDDPYAGFNLLGNPYPSAVDWNEESGWIGRTEFLDDQDGTGYAYWVWNDTEKNYGTYSTALKSTQGTHGTSAHIAAMQAFWVRAQTAGDMAVNQQARVHSGQAWLKSEPQVHGPSHQQALEAQGSSTQPIRLLASPMEAAAYGPSDEVLIETGHQRAAGAAPKLFSHHGEAPSLYVQWNNKPYSIFLIPEPHTHVQAPLGFRAGRAGWQQLQLTTHAPALYLEDRFSGHLHPLRPGAPYRFHAHPDDAEERFILHFGGPLSTSDPQVPVEARFHTRGNELFVLNPWEEAARLQVFDMAGRLRLQQTAPPGQSRHLLPAAPGIYLISLTTATQRHTGKKTVIQNP